MKRVFWPLVPEYRDATHILHLNLIQDTSTAVVAGTNERGSSREAVPKGYFQENKHSRLLRHPQCTLEVEGVQVLEGGLPVPKTFTCSPHPVGNLQVFYYVPSEWKDAFQDEHRAAPGSLTAALQCLSHFVSTSSARHASPAVPIPNAAGFAAPAAPTSARTKESEGRGGLAASISVYRFHHPLLPGLRSATVLCVGGVMDWIDACIFSRWSQWRQVCKQPQQEQQQQLQPTQGSQREPPEDDDFSLHLPLPPQEQMQLGQQQLPRNLLLPLPPQLPSLEEATQQQQHQGGQDPICFSTYIATAAADLRSRVHSATAHDSLLPAQILAPHATSDTHQHSLSPDSPSYNTSHVRSVRFTKPLNPTTTSPPPSTLSPTQSDPLELDSPLPLSPSIIASSSSRFKRNSVNAPSSPPPRTAHRLKRSSSAFSIESPPSTPPLSAELHPPEPSTSPHQNTEKPTKIPSCHVSEFEMQPSSEVIKPAPSTFASFRRRASASFFGFGQSKIPSSPSSPRNSSDSNKPTPSQQPTTNGGVKGTHTNPQPSSNQRGLIRSASDHPSRAESSRRSSLACSQRLEEVLLRGSSPSSGQRRKSHGDPLRGSADFASQLRAGSNSTRWDVTGAQHNASEASANDAAVQAGAAAGRASSRIPRPSRSSLDSHSTAPAKSTCSTLAAGDPNPLQASRACSSDGAAAAAAAALTRSLDSSTVRKDGNATVPATASTGAGGGAAGAHGVQHACRTAAHSTARDAHSSLPSPSSVHLTATAPHRFLDGDRLLVETPDSHQRHASPASGISTPFSQAPDTLEAKQQQAKEGAVGRAGGSRSGVRGLCSQQGQTQRSMSVLLVPQSFMVLCSMLQHVLGLWLGLLLWTHSNHVLQWIESSGLQLGQGMEHNITWLMAARPFGIKLHAELCFLYGRTLLHLVRAVAAVAAPIWRLCAPCTLCLLAMLGVVFGATAVLAACRDLLLLVCMPLTAAHCGMAFLLRLQLHYVKSMWGMMRGNVRKPRQMQLRAMAERLAGTASSSSTTAHGTKAATVAVPVEAPGVAASGAPATAALPADSNSCGVMGSGVIRTAAPGESAMVALPADGNSCGVMGSGVIRTAAPAESATVALPADGNSSGGTGKGASEAAVPGAPCATVTAAGSSCKAAGKRVGLSAGFKAGCKALVHGQQPSSNGSMHAFNAAAQGDGPRKAAAGKGCSDDRAAAAHVHGAGVAGANGGADSALRRQGGGGGSIGQEPARGTHLPGAGEHRNGSDAAASECPRAAGQATKQQPNNRYQQQATKQQGQGGRSREGWATQQQPNSRNQQQQANQLQGLGKHSSSSSSCASEGSSAACNEAMPAAKQQKACEQCNGLSAVSHAEESPPAKQHGHGQHGHAEEPPAAKQQRACAQGDGSVNSTAGCTEAMHASMCTNADEQSEGGGQKSETAHATTPTGADEQSEGGGQKSERVWFHVPGLRGNRLASESLWGMGTKKKQEVVAEPLIVGVLLFVPLLALLPTTLAWHLLVTSAHMAAVLLRLLLLLLASLLQHNPMLLLVWRLAHPMSFPGGFTVDMLVPASEAMVKRSTRSLRISGLAKQPAAQGLVKWVSVRNAQLHGQARGHQQQQQQQYLSPRLATFERQQCATESHPFDRFVCSHYSVGQEHPAQRHRQLQRDRQQQQQQQQQKHPQQGDDCAGHTTFYAVQRLPLPISSLLASCVQAVLGAVYMQPYPAPGTAAGQEEEVCHHCSTAGGASFVDLASCLACGKPAFWQC